jgi:hypothetical protein
MALSVDGASYSRIAPEMAAADNTAAWEDGRVGSTENLNYVTALRLIPGADLSLQMQPPFNSAGTWGQPADYSFGSVSNLVSDPSINGFNGASIYQGWTDGNVDSGSVENFELDGRRAEFPMQAASGGGPVGFSDLAGVIATSLAQDAIDYPTPYESAVSVVSGF